MHYYEQARRAVESADWLAALWQLTDDGTTCANPHLETLLRYTSRLNEHQAFECVARLRRLQSRDQLIKAVVGAAYGGAAKRGELYTSLQALLAQAEELTGVGPYRLFQQARAEARQRAEALAGELDPASDLAEITGEPLPLHVVLAPSVLLPLPQAGRHGVLVRTTEKWVAHLHFGFPLHQDAASLGINRSWLLGGAWHYAIHLYLERYWPSIERELAAQRGLAEAFSSILGSLRELKNLSWTEVLRAHVNVALKGVLARRLNVPDSVHNAFAKASGLVFFPWFEEWLREPGTQGSGLAAHISKLPDALVAARSHLERLAHSCTSTPPTVNLALISPSARRACLVVPDEWSQQTASDAIAGWRLFPLRLVRYSEWAGMPDQRAEPVIAFGEPERNPLVRRVLAQRELSLDNLAKDSAIIAISLPDLEDAAWCIAVAVKRPEVAATLRMEMALERTSSHIILKGGVVVDAGRVSLSQLYPQGGRPVA